MTVAGHTFVSNGPEHTELSEPIGRLAGLALRIEDPAVLRDALVSVAELLAGGAAVAVAVAALLKAEIDRAAIDRDIVRLRTLWIRRTLIMRCMEGDVPRTFDELERGELWPRPTERI